MTVVAGLALQLVAITAAAKTCKPGPGTALDLDAIPMTKSTASTAALNKTLSKRTADELSIDFAFQWKKNKVVTIYTRCNEKVGYGGVAVIKTGRKKGPKAVAHLPDHLEPRRPHIALGRPSRFGSSSNAAKAARPVFCVAACGPSRGATLTATSVKIWCSSRPALTLSRVWTPRTRTTTWPSAPGHET